MDEHFYSIQILIEKHFVSWYCKRCVINLIKVQVVNHCHEKTGVQKSYFVEILIKCFRLLWHLVTQKNRKKKKLIFILKSTIFWMGNLFSLRLQSKSLKELFHCWKQQKYYSLLRINLNQSLIYFPQNFLSI